MKLKKWAALAATGALAARTGESLALADGGGAVLRGRGDQGADGGALIPRPIPANPESLPGLRA